MRITKDDIYHFEKTQNECGSKVALENFQFMIAKELLNDIGVKRLSVTYFRDDESEDNE